MSPRLRLLVRVWPWVLAVLVLAPALAPGHVLSYDMVWVPDLALRPDFLGLGSGLPRAVPSDALVAALDEVLPGQVLQKALLLTALGLGGAGVQRLVPSGSALAQLAATSLFTWNAYVAERLVLGHWPTLLAYAALPWLADAVRRWRDGSHRSAGVVGWLALAAVGAAGGLMSLAVALAFGAGRGRAGRRRAAALVGWWLAVNAPWVVAGLVHASSAVSDPVGARVFAAHGEGSLPAPLAVLGLGGVWNAEVVPASRLGVLAWVSLVVVVLVCAAGVRDWLGHVGRRDAVGAGVCAAVGLVVASAGVLAPDGVAWLVAHVPGAGLVRDGSRYVGLLALVEAWLFGLGAARLGRAPADPLARRALAVGAVLVPVALLPDLGWGAGGRLRPVDYPAAWSAARAVVADRDAGRGSGDVLVLPFTAYRAPVWNGGRKVFDPLGRYLTPDYVASDELSVSGRPVRGEDPRGDDVRRALAAGTPQARAAALTRLGIGVVARERDAPGAGGPLDPPVAGRVLLDEGGLEVLVPEGVPDDDAPGAGVVVAVGAAWLALLAAVLWAGLRWVWSAGAGARPGARRRGVAHVARERARGPSTDR